MAMVIRKGPIVNKDGKQGGTIFRTDQCGEHAQAAPRLIKKRSNKQDLIRKGFTDLRYVWSKVLSRDARRKWHYWSLQHPVRNKKGELISLTGFPIYLHYNQENWLKGIPPEWYPPGYTMPDGVEPEWNIWLKYWLFFWGA